MKYFNLSSLIVVIFLTTTVFGQESESDNEIKKFYVKPYAGFIGIQDMEIQYLENGQSTDISIESGFGFTSGISFGYHFTKNFSAELGWEYKRNDITVKYDNDKSTGDYASNFIYLNGFYNFNSQGKLKPYVGLGVSIIEEIDIDLTSSEEESFSDSGNVGFQGLAGLDFDFSKRWALNWEAKYVVFSDFDMESEINDNTLSNLEYKPFIFNIGIKYRF